MNPTRIVSVLCFLCFLCCSSSLSPQAYAQDAQREKERIRKCWEAARPSMVGLEIKLSKKSRTERGEDDYEALSDEERQVRALADSRQTLDAWGVVIDADGTILTPDMRLTPEEVEKITATASDGAPFEVKLDAMGRHHDFVTLKPAEPRRDLMPVAFEEFKRFELGTSYYTAYIERVDQQWHINVSPYIVTNAPLRDEKSWLLIDHMRRGSLLFDSEARPVGIPLDQFLWIDGERDSFIGRAILSDERIAMSDIEKKTGEIGKALAEATRKIEARIREDRPLEYGEGGSGLLTLYGLPIDEKGTYLIPRDLGAEVIRRIEEPRALGADKPVPAEFVGSFKEFGAALIRVPGAATKPSIMTDVSGMELGTLYWTASLQEKFGRAFVEVKANRVFRLARGPKGDFKPAFRWGARQGTFVLDYEGRPIGVYTDQRKKEDIEEAALEGGVPDYRDYRFYRGRWPGDSSGARYILLFSELKDALAEPASHFDPRAVPMTTKRSEERRVGKECRRLCRSRWSPYH
jgi:hypothetical protein